LGGAKESEVRELLRKLAGRRVDGELFGRKEPVHVPDFTRIEPYLSPDGQVELDALAENEERWVVEVKWRQKRVGKRELRQLVEHAEQFAAQSWCVSRAGFTPGAVEFAAEQGILLSGADDLKKLGKME
jgi:hypothetical protein